MADLNDNIKICRRQQRTNNGRFCRITTLRHKDKLVFHSMNGFAVEQTNPDNSKYCLFGEVVTESEWEAITHGVPYFSPEVVELNIGDMLLLKQSAWRVFPSLPKTLMAIGLADKWHVLCRVPGSDKEYKISADQAHILFDMI